MMVLTISMGVSLAGQHWSTSCDAFKCKASHLTCARAAHMAGPRQACLIPLSAPSQAQACQPLVRDPGVLVRSSDGSKFTVLTPRCEKTGGNTFSSSNRNGTRSASHFGTEIGTESRRLTAVRALAEVNTLVSDQLMLRGPHSCAHHSFASKSDDAGRCHGQVSPPDALAAYSVV